MAMVAVKTDRTSAAVGHGPVGGVPRTAATRPAAPGRRALRLVAADGRLVQRPPAPREGSTERTPVRLTRRGRIVVTAAAVLAIGAVSVAVGGAARATGHSGAPAGPGGAVTRVEIRPGESMWSVAEAYDPDADTRVVISEIMQLNSLASAQVQPGQLLWVPRG